MISRWRIVILLLATAMLVPSGFCVPPAYSAAGGNDYEIPLADLKKVEKKKAKKVTSRKHTDRKKAHAASQEVPQEASGATEASGQPAPLPPETEKNVVEVMDSPDSAYISHEPYSYVIPGKRTVIKAIFSRDAVQSVRCRFRSLERGGYASIAMTRVPGSQFTYVATLPALESGVAALLRYRFLVVDASGAKTYSQEFVTSVKSTSVMPGWQQDPSGGPVRVTLENPRQPLEGFSDVVPETADR